MKNINWLGDTRPYNFKSFYNKDARYCDEASELHDIISDFAQPLFEEYTRKGYNPRDIYHLMCEALFGIKLDMVLGLDEYQSRDEKEEFLNDETNR